MGTWREDFGRSFSHAWLKRKIFSLDPDLAFTTSGKVINHMVLRYILQEQGGRRDNNACDGRSPRIKQINVTITEHYGIP